MLRPLLQARAAMPSPSEFAPFAQWAGILTTVAAVLAALGFVGRWGIRFRLVGITGFMGVLAVGLFGLSLGVFNYTQVPGAVNFTLAYDDGANRAVIVLPSEVDESEVEATLRKAAADLFSYGRLGRGGDDHLIVRARTVIHPQPDLSEPLYLGRAARSLSEREGTSTQVEVFAQPLARLADYRTGEAAP